MSWWGMDDSGKSHAELLPALSLSSSSSSACSYSPENNNESPTGSESLPPSATERLQYYHLIERFEPSRLLFVAHFLSERLSSGYFLLMGYFYCLLVFRYFYLRVINSPNDLVSLLMLHILAQYAVELATKIRLVYGGSDFVLMHKRFQLLFGWKSVYLFLALLVACVLTALGTVSDYRGTFNNVTMVQMVGWRACLSLYCFLLANDNTYSAQLYHEHFFFPSTGSDRIYLSSIVDKKDSPSKEEYPEVFVIPKSSQEEILTRVKSLMPTFVLMSTTLKFKSVFNVLNSAVFFVLSLGVIGHSEHNGMFYYNIFMIVLMSTISYTSFETISQFNSILDKLDSALDNVHLHLHVRVSSYAVDDRFLTMTTGAAFLQVVLKIFGIS